jgi:hypothetical protein
MGGCHLPDFSQGYPYGRGGEQFKLLGRKSQNVLQHPDFPWQSPPGLVVVLYLETNLFPKSFFLLLTKPKIHFLPP